MISTSNAANPNLAMAQRIVCWQLLLCFVAFVVVAVLMQALPWSLLMGGVMVSLVNLAFAYYFFSRWQQRSVKQIITLFYVGEVIKMLLCGLLAVFFVKWLQLSAALLIVGMLLAYMGFWVMAPLSMRQQSKGSSAV